MEDTITIDSAGRVVIPVGVRRRLALTGGTQLEIVVEGDTIRLRPLADGDLERRGRRLVVASPLEGEVPDHRDVRDERADAIAGGED